MFFSLLSWLFLTEIISAYLHVINVSTANLHTFIYITDACKQSSLWLKYFKSTISSTPKLTLAKLDLPHAVELNIVVSDINI